jgi:ribosomal protein L4
MVLEGLQVDPVCALRVAAQGRINKAHALHTVFNSGQGHRRWGTASTPGRDLVGQFTIKLPKRFKVTLGMPTG